MEKVKVSKSQSFQHEVIDTALLACTGITHRETSCIQSTCIHKKKTDFKARQYQGQASNA